MTSFNADVACDRQADEDLAYEVGPAHDYLWHRRHRARRGEKLVDIAILVGLAAMICCLVLVLHH
jgi:hypothetical protein